MYMYPYMFISVIHICFAYRAAGAFSSAKSLKSVPLKFK